MSTARELRRASGLYRSFRERTPKRAKVIRVRWPKALAVIGHVEFIGYSTSHGGRAKLYRHDFAPGSRPYLCADGKTRRIFILGGRYRFTDLGIVDVTAKGKEIDD